MALTSAQVSVTTTATALNTADSSGRWMTIRVSVPTGGQAVFLGASGVTTTTGLSVAAGSSVEVKLPPGDTLYGIVAATTQTTHVLRTV